MDQLMGVTVGTVTILAALCPVVLFGAEVTSTPCLPEDYLRAICFSPYTGGQAPGDAIPRGQIRERLGIVAPYTNAVRSYGATHGLENIPEEARAFGLGVAMGAWIAHCRQEELDNLVSKTHAGWVDFAIVGNEEIYAGRETDQSLAPLVREVQGRLEGVGMGHIPVTTAEPFHTLFDLDGAPRQPQLLDAVDVVVVNVYPFWEGAPIEDAVSVLEDRYSAAVRGASGKQVIIGETGWPTEGLPKDRAVPSLENAARYLRDAVSWARENDVLLFSFEAFDEGWKEIPVTPYRVEDHWGVWDAEGALKIPEPASLSFLGMGALALLCRQRVTGAREPRRVANAPKPGPSVATPRTRQGGEKAQ